MRLFDSTVFRFSIVGISNTLFGVSVIFLAKYAGLDDVSANILGYGFGLSISFSANKSWTFSYYGPTVSAAGRFFVVTAVSYLANLTVVMIAIRELRMDSYAAQALGVPVYAVSNYFGCRKFAFQRTGG